MQGVAMVAASPVEYDDHSTLVSPREQQSRLAPDAVRPASRAPDSPHFAPVQPQPQPQSAKPLDIQAYQPPWSSLADYAQQHYASQQQQQPRPDSAGAELGPPIPDADSPRFQQIIGQVSSTEYNSQARACALRRAQVRGFE